MNIKNISNFFFITLLLFLSSCKSLEILSEKNESDYEYSEIKETSTNIDVMNHSINYLDIEDFYNKLHISFWNNENDFIKLHTFKSYESKNRISRPLISLIFENKFILLNHESKLNIYDLNNFKIINSLDLNMNSNINTFYPTSIARVSDNFFVSYSDGKIINFDLQGEINWIKKFTDIIKTPIKIFNDQLILLLSNKIVSLNLISGFTNWEFLYESDNVLQATGGDIVSMNHLLFFILPNSRIGQIDTVFGEKNDSILLDINFEDSINNSFDKLHSYKNIISYFDQGKYLSSIDVAKNKILLNQEKIFNVNSFFFFNNSLITLHKEGILKFSNIFNRNLFWKINIVDLIKDNDKIINVTTFNESLILFFKSGIVIEINSLNGELISHKNLKIKNIDKVTINNMFFLIQQKNGNTSIFSK